MVLHTDEPHPHVHMVVKAVSEQGVRMNIRPFVQAGVLRKNPNIKWTKDRGKEPQRDKDEYPWFWNGSSFTGERVNDIHLTVAEKQAGRTKRSGRSMPS